MSREQFVQRVLRRVRLRFPLVKLARAAEDSFTLLINGNLAHLEHLYRASLLEPSDLAHHVDRWIVEMLRAGENIPDRDTPYQSVKDRIYPVILAERGHYPHVERAASPFVAGLRIAYGLDGDRMISYLPDALFLRWGVSLEELHEQALANLTARSRELQGYASPDEEGRPSLVVFQTLDGYDASRVLLPELHRRLSEHLGSPFVAAIPNRDVLLCFRDDPATVQRLHAQVKKDHRQMPHQITERLLLVTADGIAERCA